MLIVPLGSTEQHGPHLPLETDTIIATAWAAEVARRLGVTCAPALPYGSAGEHQSFQGTLSIGSDALVQLLVELTRSAVHHHDSVAFLCGHGGNAEPLKRALDQLTAEGHTVWGLLPSLAGADAHAGHTETSLLLFLAPQLVNMGRAEAGNTEPLTDLLADMKVGGLEAVTANGVLGDPTKANAGDGEVVFNELVDYALAELSRAAQGPA